MEGSSFSHVLLQYVSSVYWSFQKTFFTRDLIAKIKK
ncbi:hypothetical protein FXW27_00300 [Candidatus Liberibacter asiaticus]|nr:hypothetical protein FXW27_00300 [Candidatus Liberibacter asiaticus]